jgi:hypothetical protein
VEIDAMHFKNEEAKDKAEEKFCKAHGVYATFDITNNRADNWEDIEIEIKEHDSVAVTSLGEGWGAISANHLTKKEKKKLLKIIEADTDED